MGSRKFSIGEAVGFGWDTAIKNIVFFVALLLGMWFIAMVFQFVGRAAMGNWLFMMGITIISWVVNAVLAMGVIKITLKFCDGQKIEMEDVYSSYPLLLNYIAAAIIFGIVSVIGLALLVVPGIILMLRLQFFAYFIVDRKEGPVQALKSSWEATKGYSLTLLGLCFTFLGIMILGALVIVVGLLVAIPVTMIAMAFVYRKLSSGVVSEAAAKPAAVPPPAQKASAHKDISEKVQIKIPAITLDRNVIMAGGIAAAFFAGVVFTVIVTSGMKGSNAAREKPKPAVRQLKPLPASKPAKVDKSATFRKLASMITTELAKSGLKVKNVGLEKRRLIVIYDDPNPFAGSLITGDFGKAFGAASATAQIMVSDCGFNIERIEFVITYSNGASYRVSTSLGQAVRVRKDTMTPDEFMSMLTVERIR